MDITSGNGFSPQWDAIYKSGEHHSVKALVRPDKPV